MTSETTIKEITSQHLGNVRSPDILGFVDQLFILAAQNGAISGTLYSEKQLQFSVIVPSADLGGATAHSTQILNTYLIEHEIARTILRMICARLGVLCKEHSDSEFLPYGNQCVLDYPFYEQSRWNVSFTNTSERQEFLIEAP